MDYKKVYDQLINKALSENRVKLKRDHQDYVYYEKHHIIPRCIGGTNESSNLVLLTAREHFVAHWLLYRIHPENKGLARGFRIMCVINTPTKKSERSYTISSRLFQECRELSKSLNRGKVLSVETKNKISKAKKGKSIASKGKPKTQEHIANMTNLWKVGNEPWNKGLQNHLPESSIKSISNSLKEYYKTNENPFKGKKHTLEAIEKNRQKHIGKRAWNAKNVYVIHNDGTEEVFATFKECQAHYTEVNSFHLIKSLTHILVFRNFKIIREKFKNANNKIEYYNVKY